MSKSKMINSQLNNWKTYLMYKRQMITLAENVYEFKNLPQYIDVSFLNKTLLRNGEIAFFYEEELKSIVALPFKVVGTRDLYGRPNKIEVYASNGYRRVLWKKDYVIMYDNNAMYPLYLDICQYAERYADIIRTTDINVAQQKTPRLWKTPTEKYTSVKNLMNNVDSLEESILTYSDIDLDDTTAVLAPAPYVTDKLDMHSEKIWNEFLRLIGVTNLAVTKKERNISDEIEAMQGGTVASRFSRFDPRKRAIEEINIKFKEYLEKPLEVYYYDGEPTTEEEVEKDVSMDDVSNSNAE